MALVPQLESHGSNRQLEGNPSGQAIRQSRQPTTLQGLLRFAMEATKAEDAPHDAEFQPMDDERKKFLEDALKSMTIDVVEVLQNQIRTLQKVNRVRADDDVSQYEEALEKILEYVDHIDIANDFHKIGGCVVLHPCLQCPHPKIRAGVCDLLAVLCQNNPYCQQIILDHEFVPKLLNIIENDEDTQVVVKALYALSGRLVFLDYIPTLIQLMSTERSPSHEHVLGLLVSLVEENPTAVAECKNSKYNLKETLQKYISVIRNKEEYLEEEQYCKRLLHLLFSGV
ncbi:hypothetical protein NQ314_012148 [Rhamnusium bicolor]|uniref:Nucleotide exchange factor Fes1 domain-containing protein n=1 Tax=Rhamnusium bicolor TaxID=1586634 RepID=A0AAV8XEA4_9CUCU|nr:hypothetical protein NQ314_012148 [Rhamnusium bicolor]